MHDGPQRSDTSPVRRRDSLCSERAHSSALPLSSSTEHHPQRRHFHQPQNAASPSALGEIGARSPDQSSIRPQVRHSNPSHYNYGEADARSPSPHQHGTNAPSQYNISGSNNMAGYSSDGAGGGGVAAAHDSRDSALSPSKSVTKYSQRRGMIPVSSKIGAREMTLPEPQLETPPGAGVSLNPDGSFSRGGSYNRRHFVADKRRHAEEMRKSKELNDYLQMQIAEKEALKHRSLHRERSLDRELQGGPAWYGSSSSPNSSSKRAGVGVGPGGTDLAKYNSASKASPEWLQDDDDEEGVVGPPLAVIPQTTSEVIEQSPQHIHHHQKASSQPRRASNSPVRGKPLFDHEKRKQEDIEREKVALVKQEELKVFLEKQIEEQQRRKKEEREAELRLERELEERSKLEAELQAERERLELQRERGEDPQAQSPPPGGSKDRDDAASHYETALQRRKRLAEEQRRKAQGERSSSERPLHSNEHGTKSLSPDPLHRFGSSSDNGGALNSHVSPARSEGPTAFERDMMVSLEMIQKELLEQRKRLMPLTPLPASANSPPPMKPPTSTAQTPPPSFAPAFSIPEPHPAHEILERNKSRLSALRYARHHDDVLKAFLMEDQTKAMRSYEKYSLPRLKRM